MSISPEYRTPSGQRRRRVRVYDPRLGRSVHVGVVGPVPARDGQPSKTTLQAARDLEAEALMNRAIPPAASMTVEQLRDLWLEVRSATVGPGSLKHYTDTTRPFVREYGHIKVRDFDRPTAMRIGAKTKTLTTVGSSMWAFAVDAGLARENVWQGLQKKGKRRFDPGWMTDADVERLGGAAMKVHGVPFGPMWRALVYVGAYCGLRPGELAGLRWSDLDFDAGLLTVEQQAHPLLRTFTPPKNGHVRTVSFAPIAIDAVRSMSVLHNDLLFVALRGGVLWPSARHYAFDPIRRAIDRPKMHLHELRHFAATWLQNRGVTHSDVAYQLGHQDGGALVASTYGHPDPRIAIARVQAAHRAGLTPDPEPQEATA